MKKFIRRSLKIIGWILLSLIFLLVLVLILIQVPAVQSFARKKAVVYLENKIRTKVQISKLSIKFPKQIVLEGIYFEDQTKDTLLAGDKIQVDISMLKLLRNTVKLNYLELDGITAKVKRLQPDTTFNFDYIINAFSSGSKDTTTSTDTSSMKFEIGTIRLNKIRAIYHDDVAGMDATVNLAKFETSIDTFDPSRSDYDIPNIQLAGISSSVRQYKPLIEPKPMDSIETKSNEPIKVKLQLKNIQLNDIHLDYENDISRLYTALDLGKLKVLAGATDLSKLFIQLKQLQLDNTSVKVNLGRAKQARVVKTEVKKNVKAQVDNPWKIVLDQVDFNNNQLSYNDSNAAVVKKGMDYSHLGITDFILKASNLAFTPVKFEGDLKQLSFKDKSGFVLNNVSTQFLYGEKDAQLKNLQVATPSSRISTSVTAKYPSQEMLATKPGEIFTDASIDTFNLAAKDILLLSPSLETYLKGHEQAVIKLKGKAHGYVKDIALNNIELSGYGSTAVQMSGNIKGLPDGKNAYYNINIAKLSTSRKDLLALIPKNTLPSNIRIPQSILLSGNYKGTTSAFSTVLNARTTNGTAKVSGSLNTRTEAYNLKASTQNLNVGYLISQDSTIGRITLTASAKGRGFDYKTLTTNVDATLVEGELKGYTYKNLQLKAFAEPDSAFVESSIDDPNIRYALRARANLASKFPTNLRVRLDLDTLNLQALHLSSDSLQFHTKLFADMPSANPDSLIGLISIAETIILQDSNRFAIDTVKVLAAHGGDTQSIALTSSFAEVNWKGKYKLTETATALQHTINKYYRLKGFKDTAFTEQDWQMHVFIKPSSPTILQFVPELRASDTIGAMVQYKSKEDDLQVNMHAPKIKYGEQTIDKLTLTAQTSEKNIAYALKIADAGTKGFRLNQTAIYGNIDTAAITTSVLLKDKKAKDRYHIMTKLQQIDSAIKITFVPDSLMLNYEAWNMPADNYFQYDSSGIIINDFNLNKGNQAIKLNSTAHTPNAPIDVAFENFRIKTLTEFADQDSLFMDGVIDGKAVVKDVTKNPVFTADMLFKDISYKTDTVGNIALKVNNETSNVYNADVKIDGHGNDITLNGNYYTGEGKMDLKLNLNNVNLATIKNFSAGSLRDAGGSLKGNIDIAGTTKEPVVNGNLRFVDAFVTPTMLGERFKLANENITIQEKAITFNKFTLTDSAGSKAILDGTISTKDYVNYQFGLTLKADEFSVVSSTQADNKLFYGKLNIDADIKVNGDLRTPAIQAGLKVNKSTNFTFVLPSEDPELEERKGIVRFVDMDAPKDTVTTARQFQQPRFQALADLDLSANVETDSAAQFILVIDERNGDALKIRGKADLSGGVDESGRLTLTGNYELVQGSYQLTLSILKRKFDIQRGSVITWTGDPTSANVDITAAYSIKTAPIDLVEQQLAGKSESETNKYKEKIPVTVLLKMKGELLKPVITFDITIPQEQQSQWSDVEAKLDQLRANEAEMNKQVFALLLLGRFMQEDPMASNAGGTAEGMARESVSRILTDQLNQLAGTLIKGVDVNFGINSGDTYYTGQRETSTDFSVGVSKSLLNDRLKVSVGSDFMLEKPANSAQANSNIAGDVAVDYQLSKDGRYKVRGYRKNKYDAVVEGQVIETGLTFILTLDYDKFRELFTKAKKND
ncbi:translocation/assembly module TamB domain-containing protein [Danxiaibacter flavus]|uniref:Translocation/assembly module TamB domain-containing protein n=1 Tax=Danxiaibacter flavus TaxID=3049108 RepID=A0ABV3ZQG6_9BACT|nr:translocation/assembly module TamB domain-containing protein [Chitinophagaceae bacterium DXS]